MPKPESIYIELARSGLRMPVGADLVLHEESDPETVKHDAGWLGRVVESTARRFHTPLAFPLMDLALEKADLLSFLGVADAEADSYHLSEPPALAVLDDVYAAAGRPFSRRIAANQGAVRYISEKTDLVPVGMLIGPFSLATKLVADPIWAVAMAGNGVTAGEDAGVLLMERCLALAEATVARSAKAQISAGARAVIVGEPAANKIYLSPRQLRAGSDIFERFVLGPNRRLRGLLGAHGVDLIFHDCGELTIEMVRQFAVELRPAMMSFGVLTCMLWQGQTTYPLQFLKICTFS
ncbi:MAG: hypothetical protein M1436_04845, partial [Acidobacteria bacterium]|nr:hypothetical protein [Acidobacteriota bacterium]